ncbi:hypothetical protein FN976_25660 [Caenimonas sedimenti]|uniref:Uncharacterized protein n=1 Tax=Caenimonas sedimenti TaxID=2596921 RepID=A0A562ZHI8_9BURK|nr:hypothetical protein [Caenimonas sedimenti]TWO67775.1 hypothetical protein FN976_25660 [Caenimonas sedimenti]
MPYPYTVMLVDAVELPSVIRVRAEARCAAALERALGGPEAVVSALTAYTAANDSPPENLDADTMAMAARWYRVAEQARQEGLRNLSVPQEAHFDIRLQRGATSSNTS